jgi:hypothetical protein
VKFAVVIRDIDIEINEWKLMSKETMKSPAAKEELLRIRKANWKYESRLKEEIEFVKDVEIENSSAKRKSF